MGDPGPSDVEFVWEGNVFAGVGDKEIFQWINDSANELNLPQVENGSKALRFGRASPSTLWRAAFLADLGPGDLAVDIGSGDG